MKKCEDCDNMATGRFYYPFRGGFWKIQCNDCHSRGFPELTKGEVMPETITIELPPYVAAAIFQAIVDASVHEAPTKMSENGRAALVEMEGRKKYVYNDSAGFSTIGVGHLLTQSELSSSKMRINGKPVKWRLGLTARQIDELLSQDLRRFEESVVDNVTVPLNQSQLDALVSFAFNVGESAFKSSTLLSVLNQGRYIYVPDQLRRWVYAGGKRSDGLENRREKEIEIWHGNDHL